MSYELFQFNCGTDTAQGYVLVGRGEHEGTNCPVSVGEMNALIDNARIDAKARGYNVRARFINAPNRDDGLEVKNMVAAELDRLFMRALAERHAPVIAAALSPSAQDPR